MMLLLLLACKPEPAEGTFLGLTYNIAGLPQGISSSDPERFIPQIGEKLNSYDLVLVQEDFSYHDELAADITLPFASIPKEPEVEFVADGLNRFSNLVFSPVERTQWAVCNGLLDGASDCLAEKGFSIAVTTLSEEVTVTVVNLHAEAGSGPLDLEARATGMAQLTTAIEGIEGALIVAGDTNIKPLERPADAATMDAFLSGTGLTEVEQNDPTRDHIDRWFFRSSDTLELTPSEWAIAEEFVSPEGDDLSDHPAIQTRFSWKEVR